MTAIAQWRGLRVEVVDVATQAGFWSVATGLTVAGTGDDVRLEGPTAQHTVRLVLVQRPPSVKNRLHLDVDCAEGSGIDDLVALGARVLTPAAESGFSWSVMADPEGQEFCAFERPAADVPAYRLHGVVIDSIDHAAIAGWWAGVLGTTRVDHAEHGYSSLEDVAVDSRMTLDFVPVPEPRTAANRVRWEVAGDVDRLVSAGATRLGRDGDLIVLADPEGNEFGVAEGLPD